MTQFYVEILQELEGLLKKTKLTLHIAVSASFCPRAHNCGDHKARHTKSMSHTSAVDGNHHLCQVHTV